MSMGFFATVLDVCRGTSGFPMHVENPLGKVVLHWLLLALLVSLLVCVGQTWRFEREMNGLARRFAIAFGSELMLTDKGIVPGRDPEKSVVMDLPRGGRLFYMGAGRGPSLDGGDLSGLRYVICWNGGGLPSMAVSVGENAWSVSRFGSSVRFRTVSGGKETMAALVEKGEERRWSWGEHKSMRVEEFFKALCASFAIMTFLYQLLTMLLTTLLCTVVLLIFFSIGRAGRLRGMRLWKAAIYAGFPGMLIGGLFPALELPLLDYVTVYALGLAVYGMFAIHRVEIESRNNSQEGC